MAIESTCVDDRKCLRCHMKPASFFLRVFLERRTSLTFPFAKVEYLIEYRKVISLFRKEYSIRDVAKLSGKGVSTVQRVKRLIKVQSSQ